jgi:hypothetical protein
MEHKPHRNCSDTPPAALAADATTATSNTPASRRSSPQGDWRDRSDSHSSPRSAGSQSLDRAGGELSQAAEAILTAAQKLSSGPELFVLRDV